MRTDFSIPVSLQEVDARPEYTVEELVSGGLLEECMDCLSVERSFCVDSCFSVYIHLLRQFPRVPSGVRVDYWTVLSAGLRGLCGALASRDLPQLSSEEKQTHRNQLKMLTYLLVQWTEASENACAGSAGKKQSVPSGWKAGREGTISLLRGMMELPLVSLWDPPSPAMMDDLAGLVGTGCYKILENPSITRERGLADKTVALLGMLIRDYSQGLSFSLKVTQLLHHFEHLVSPLSQAVVLLATQFGVKSIVADIIREIASKDPKDLSADASGTRCFAGFLVEVGGALPELVLPVVSVLVPHLTGDSYTFRNGVLGVMGHLLLHLSKGQGSLATNPRDQLLNKLMEHVYDNNAFVRVKVLQVLEQLVTSQAIPLHSLQETVELACGRLSDKSSSVRKVSLHLLTSSLQCNPFAAKLEGETFRGKLREEEEKLKALVEASGEQLEGEGLEEEGRGRELAKQLTVVSYLQNAVKFVDLICEYIPLVVQILGSKVTSDVLEAINFLSKCASFGISAAQPGVQRSLGLVWSGDATVRKAVLDVHVQLYLDSQEEGDVGRARTVANNLVALVKSSSRGQLASLEKLLGMLVEGDYITAPVIKCLWDSFQQRGADSALAVQVLSMVASVHPDVINNNFELLVRTGIAGHDQSPDLVLAECTCSALSKMSASSLPDGKLLPVDNPLLSQLREILLGHLSNLSTSRWAGLTEVVLLCVFKLCVSPITYCQDLLHTLVHTALSQEGESVNSVLLSRVLFTAGVVAHRLMLYSETTVSKELKRRAMDREDKQPATDKDGEELALAGASGDDPTIELVKRVLEREVGGASGLLATFEPLLVEILVNPTKYPSADLSNSAALALAKFMLVSPTLCERYLQLFFTVLEKSEQESVRANSVIMASDLACRFPNLIEPWTPHLYARLSDESRCVRKNTLTVLTHLILNDMVKVRGQISAIALAIEDSDPKIADLAKHFFHELASKGNTLYNVIPDIVSSLSGGEQPTEQHTFHAIVRYILSLIQKDKQCESLVEKLCHRFRAARSERQARDLAHCISQLSVSERSLRKLQDNFACYKDWLVDDLVFEAFSVLLSKNKKFTKPEVKGLLDELERLMKDAHEKGLETSVSIETSEEVPGPEGQSDDFSEDVLSSARKSLVRNTPHSVMHKGQRRAVQSSEELSDGEDVVSKLQLDSDADQSD